MEKKYSLFLMSSVLLLVACGGGGGSSSDSSGISSALKVTGDAEPEYIVTQDDITKGSISALGVGEEQVGWNFFYSVGNTLFVTGFDEFSTKSYRVDENGDVSQLASFLFDSELVVFGAVGDHTMLATDNPLFGSHGSRFLYTVDAASGFVVSRQEYVIDAFDTGTPGEGWVAWGTALEVRGNELYIPFHKLSDDGFYSTPDPDQAYVAIYDYPLDTSQGPAQPKAIISDNRTSNIGVNGTSTGLIEADNGDLYSFSNGSGAYGFAPATTKPSGILRIRSGENEFDSEYFFNIEEATDGGKLAEFHYVGDNKVVARIATDETNAYAWSAYDKTDPDWVLTAFNGPSGYNHYNQKLVVIDLEAQTVTDVANVPLHQKRYTSPLEVMDGKVYVSIETAVDEYVYEVDIASATATQGAEIEGKTVKGFFNLYL